MPQNDSIIFTPILLFFYIDLERSEIIDCLYKKKNIIINHRIYIFEKYDTRKKQVEKNPKVRFDLEHTGIFPAGYLKVL